MADAKPARTPCSSGSKLSRFDGEVLHDYSAYRSLVGALQYCTLTRPDIAYSVNQLCQHLHHPTSTHWTAAKRVLRFLKDTSHHGITYSKSTLQLNAFCGSDWAGSPDDRRSTSGFAVFLGDNLLSWSAKKQHVVSRSSTEAEYRSLAIVTAELFWLRMLFCELHIPLLTAPVVWCDNISALALATNPVYHARTKHIEVDYHFVREKVLNQDISLAFISTDDQIADVFTKGLSTARFLFLKSKMKVIPSPVSLRGDVKPCLTVANSPLHVHEAAATTLEENKSASSHNLEDTAEIDLGIISNEDGITQGRYHHIQGKNQPAIDAYPAVMCAAQGKQNAQHGNNQVSSMPRQIIKHGNKQIPAIQHMPYSPMHDTG